MNPVTIQMFQERINKNDVKIMSLWIKLLLYDVSYSFNSLNSVICFRIFPIITSIDNIIIVTWLIRQYLMRHLDLLQTYNYV